MQKTRLGISVGLMGFITYFGCCFGGYIAAILLFGYILLVENNQWLRKTAVKAMILTIAFSLLSTFIGLIPDIIEFIGSIVNLFNGNFYLTFVSKIVTILTLAIGLIKYDDRMIITFNYKDGSKTITLAELEKSALGSDINVPAPPNEKP